MDLFTNTEIFTTSEVLTTTESTTTTELTTKSTTELTIKTTTELTEKTTVLIPIEEAKKDIILLASLGTIIFGLFLMCVVCICRRRRTKTRENLELFERLAASSSTTVFDKDQ